MSSGINAVTFDFWNTISSVPPDTMTEARRRAVAAACDACGVEVEAERPLASLADVGASYERSWAAGTHFHPRQGAEMLVRALGAEGAAAEMVAEAFLSAGRDAELALAPGIAAALSALGAEPPEAMHVGDLRRTDIAGAGALGMRTVRYRGLHDDPDRDGGPEADFLLDSHLELPDLLDRIAAPTGPT